MVSIAQLADPPLPNCLRPHWPRGFEEPAGCPRRLATVSPLHLVTPLEDTVQAVLASPGEFQGIIPHHDETRWTMDNADLILQRWLPRVARNMPPRALHVLAEAYCARVVADDGRGPELWAFEQRMCDGATIVGDLATVYVADEPLRPKPAHLPRRPAPADWPHPQALRHIKEPQAVAHDYLFMLHHLELADAAGHRWTLRAANEVYREIAAAARTISPATIGLRALALAVLAPIYWNRTWE